MGTLERFQSNRAMELTVLEDDESGGGSEVGFQRKGFTQGSQEIVRALPGARKHEQKW